MAANPKPLASTRRLAKAQTRRHLKSHEELHKRLVRKRDGYHCRFPQCGCRTLGWPLEVSHFLHHKAMGGNPRGDRSVSDSMMLLCRHRHQEGAVSLHKGTLKVQVLTERGADGPVAWLVDLDAIPVHGHGSHWFEVARESTVQQLEPLDEWQEDILLRLAEMDR